jgi:hypothetical protein
LVLAACGIACNGHNVPRIIFDRYGILHRFLTFSNPDPTQCHEKQGQARAFIDKVKNQIS